MKINVANITFSKNLFLRNELSSFFENITFNEESQRLDYDDLSNFCNNSDILILGLEKFDESLFKNNPNLKTIAKFGVGVDNIDFNLLQKFNITFLHDIGVNKLEVAEFAYCQIINLLRNISYTGNLLRNGIWLKDGGISIQESTIGVIGVGNIGSCVVDKLVREGCKKIICYDIDSAKTEKFNKVDSVEVSSLDDLCSNSDLITLHIPGDSSNFEFLGNKILNKMKQGVKILNISRGSIVNIYDVINHLDNGNVHSYCTDVYPYEPFFDSRIVNNNRIICTPHIAGNSNQSVLKMGMSVINNLVRTFK